jgi:hypothetical protein
MKTKKLKSSLASLSSLVQSTVHFLGEYVPRSRPRSTRWFSVAGAVGVGALLGAGAVIALAPGTISRVATTLSNGYKRVVGAVEIMSADATQDAPNPPSTPTPPETLDGVHDHVTGYGANGPIRS